MAFTRLAGDRRHVAGSNGGRHGVNDIGRVFIGTANLTDHARLQGRASFISGHNGAEQFRTQPGRVMVAIDGARLDRIHLGIIQPLGTRQAGGFFQAFNARALLRAHRLDINRLGGRSHIVIARLLGGGDRSIGHALSFAPRRVVAFCRGSGTGRTHLRAGIGRDRDKRNFKGRPFLGGADQHIIGAARFLPIFRRNLVAD